MTARETALSILYRWEKEEIYVDLALAQALRDAHLSRLDRSLVTELVNGVLRWKRRLDWKLNQLLAHRQVEDLTIWIRNILRIGLYQIQFLDRIPHAAATHQSVSLAKRYGHRGTAGLVNAVLRNALRSGASEPSYPLLDHDPVAHIGLRYSHPDWMVRRWLDRYGLDETMALCQANNRVPQLSVRINSLRATVADVETAMQGKGVHTAAPEMWPGFLVLKGAGDIAATEAFVKGWIQVQDPSASLAVNLLHPVSGQKIVDLCSAPGGKAAHLADLMGNRGLLLTVDLHGKRLHQLVDNCRRLGISCARPVVADGRSLALRAVDGVLVDAPCSGLGVLARRVDLRWKKEEKDISRLAQLQVELLRNAADMLKPGGRLVYSTCTLEDEENEGVLSRLLSQRRDVVVEKATPPLPDAVITPAGHVRTFPHRHGVDGIYAARLKKIRPGELT